LLTLFQQPKGFADDLVGIGEAPRCSETLDDLLVLGR
jgi:hypothetical protein